MLRQSAAAHEKIGDFIARCRPRCKCGWNGYRSGSAGAISMRIDLIFLTEPLPVSGSNLSAEGKRHTGSCLAPGCEPFSRHRSASPTEALVEPFKPRCADARLRQSPSMGPVSCRGHCVQSGRTFGVAHETPARCPTIRQRLLSCGKCSSINGQKHSGPGAVRSDSTASSATSSVASMDRTQPGAASTMTPCCLKRVSLPCRSMAAAAFHLMQLGRETDWQGSLEYPGSGQT